MVPEPDGKAIEVYEIGVSIEGRGDDRIGGLMVRQAVSVVGGEYLSRALPLEDAPNRRFRALLVIVQLPIPMT